MTAPTPQPGAAEVGLRALGVDGCQKGWVGFTNDRCGYFGRTLEELLHAVGRDGEPAVVAIDMPIGLPDHGPRQADRLARAVVGRRGSSVFPTPVRAALAAGTHAEATIISVQLTGRGLSRQAYALAVKILEVDRWARTASPPPIEVHPEVCFATMAGRPLRYAKSTWAGAVERRRLLAEAGIVVPDDLGLAGEMAGPDDVLDAAAAAWTANRFLQGRAVSYPPTPERFGDGLQAAIWA